MKTTTATIILLACASACLPCAGQSIEQATRLPLASDSYVWRTPRIEGSTFYGLEQNRGKRIDKNSFKLDSASTRLSYKFFPNWSFQFNRGTLSGLDQLMPNDDVSRTMLSTTYDRAFSYGKWQTTLAWGRNIRKSREPMLGYLLESMLRFNGAHTVFGRLEQVDSNDLPVETEAARRQLFKLNRLTVGYLRNVHMQDAIDVDAGVSASHYFVPSTVSPSYEGEPTLYMLFIRLKLQ